MASRIDSRCGGFRPEEHCWHVSTFAAAVQTGNRAQAAAGIVSGVRTDQAMCFPNDFAQDGISPFCLSGISPFKACGQSTQRDKPVKPLFSNDF
jgi:hypothetical protein